MNFPKLKIGDLVSRIPIIQGGMGVGISLSGLASAVANEGGIGVIAAAMVSGSEKGDPQGKRIDQGYSRRKYHGGTDRFQ
jgi:NAD(P)H-dependent flavin oxidoreductase YrpB (nitropropane dioxygenase family)